MGTRPNTRFIYYSETASKHLLFSSVDTWENITKILAKVLCHFVRTLFVKKNMSLPYSCPRAILDDLPAAAVDLRTVSDASHTVKTLRCLHLPRSRLVVFK